LTTLARFVCLTLALSTTTMPAASAPRRAAMQSRWAKLTGTVFRHIAQDADLPNAAIPTAFGEDGSGFLWVGTQNGLARWDGYNFHIYRREANVAGTLPDNYITTLHTDPQGRLWVGTSSSGLARYDPMRDSFIVYPAGPNGLSHVGVVAIADDGAGGLWIATEGALDHLDVQSGVTTHLRHNNGDPGSIPAERIQAMLRDKSGTLWVGTSRGLARSEGAPYHFAEVRLAAPREEESGVSSIFEDTAGRIWIGTRRHGAYVIETRGASARPVKETEAGGYRLETEQVHDIAEAGSGEIWLGTYGQGIVAVDAATMQTRRILHDPRLPDSLADDNIWSIHRDRGGLVWVGTDRSISRHDPQQKAISTIFGSSSRPDGITDASVHFVLSMPDGLIWLGLGSNGVDILDPTAARVAGIRPDAAHPASAVPKAYIDAALVSPTDEVYLGSVRGFYRTHRLQHDVTRVPLPQTDTSGEISALLIDKNILWVGGPDGLDQLDLSAGPHAPIRLNMDQFSDRRVDVIERGPPGQLWVGTENGLNRLDVTTHAVERIMADPADRTTIPSNFVNSLLTDRQGRLWVGTMDGIGVLVSGDTGGRRRFRQIGGAEGLPNDNVDKLLEDRSGNIWASTDNGLAIIDPQTFAVRALGRPAGVVVSSYWVNSGAVTADGELLFGGIGGLTVVRPDLLTDRSYRPSIVVTNILVGGKTVTSSGFNHEKPDGALEVPADANKLLVEFAALDFSAPERCRYAYRLEGYDKKWIETDAAHREAAYTNLPPGHYVLRIRGSNRDGVFAEKAIALPIHVLPAWYQTVWFELAVLLAGIGVVLISVQVRTSQLRQRQRKLEQCVAERTAELEESQRQLEHFAYFDFLTGLPNRRMFNNDLGKLLGQSRRRGGRFALMLLDLDAFKQTNDTYGHDAGDALLIEVGNRLRLAVRDSDSVARLGGDEFAILLADDYDAAAVEVVCQRIFESFAAPILFNDARFKTSLSLGVAIFPNHGRTPDGLYKTADIALYEAKRAGGNTARTGPPFGRTPELASDLVS
jgi:diguanylate cyclase (GGDEF)-like protein